MDQPERAALANDVRIACQRIARRVRYEATTEVPPHQVSVLARLRQQPMTPTRLADIEKVSTPSMTRTINCLLDEGLVSKTPHPDDGRQVVVTLTGLGEQVMQRTVAQRDCWMVDQLAPLNDDELDVLRRAADLLSAVAAS